MTPITIKRYPASPEDFERLAEELHHLAQEIDEEVTLSFADQRVETTE